MNSARSRYGYEVSPLQFTGKERDTETGLDYFGARYLSAAMGRFGGADPVNHPIKSMLGEEQFLSEPQRWYLFEFR